MEKVNILALQNGEQYSSLPSKTVAEKKHLFNVMENPTHKLAQFKGKELPIVDVVAYGTMRANAEDEEPKLTIVTILIDKDGNSYFSMSTGISNSVNSILSTFGQPDTWDEPLGVILKEQNTSGGNRIYKIQVA